MTSSPDLGELPPALSSMWRLCKLGYRHEPRLMLVSFVLSQLSAVPDALLALWLALLGKSVLEQRADLVRIAAGWLGGSTPAARVLRLLRTRGPRGFCHPVAHPPRGHRGPLPAARAPNPPPQRP